MMCNSAKSSSRLVTVDECDEVDFELLPLTSVTWRNVQVTHAHTSQRERGKAKTDRDQTGCDACRGTHKGRDSQKQACCRAQHASHLWKGRGEGEAESVRACAVLVSGIGGKRLVECHRQQQACCRFQPTTYKEKGG